MGWGWLYKNMEQSDIDTAIEVLEQLKAKFDPQTDKYADVSQTIYYLEQEK